MVTITVIKTKRACEITKMLMLYTEIKIVGELDVHTINHFYQLYKL